VCTLKTRWGVFSPRAIDDGTTLLMKYLQVNKTDKCLDLGCRMGDFMEYSHRKAMTVFYKIVKLAKNGVLMIIHIYAKVMMIILGSKIMSKKNNGTNGLL
jgi:hypothetical protein